MASPRRPDRRIQRTRALLQDALVASIISKGYEETTVQDIIDRANVGRATFYAHFADKDALLLSRLEDLRDLLRTRAAEVRAKSDESRFGFSLAFLEHAHAHWRLYQAMVGRQSGALVLRRVHELIAGLVSEEFGALALRTKAQRRDMLVQHVTGGFMGLVLAWLEGGAALSPAEADELFHDLAFRGVRSLTW